MAFGADDRELPTIEELLALVPDHRPLGRPGLFSLAPELIAKVKGCDPPQLLDLAAAVEPKGTVNHEFLLALLLVIAGEDDPAGTLKFFDKEIQPKVPGDRWKIRQTLLAQLARENPQRALKMVGREGTPIWLQSIGREIVARELFRVGEVDTGIELLDEISPVRGSLASCIASAAGDSQAANALWEEVKRRPMGDPVRDELTHGLVSAAMFSGGIQATEEAIAKADKLGPWERGKVVWLLAGYAARIDPVEAMGFIDWHSDEKYRAQAFREAISVWAHRDSVSAGRWLEAQPPSLDREKMTARYAEIIANR